MEAHSRRLEEHFTEQTKVLQEMSKALQLMQKYADAGMCSYLFRIKSAVYLLLKDRTELPLPQRKWDDERGWSALYTAAFTQSRESALALRDGLDVNLIFVRLINPPYLGVITTIQDSPICDCYNSISNPHCRISFSRPDR